MTAFEEIGLNISMSIRCKFTGVTTICMHLGNSILVLGKYLIKPPGAYFAKNILGWTLIRGGGGVILYHPKIVSKACSSRDDT